MTERSPIFLAGIDRSGIGLLGEMLEQHPAVAVTRRINFFSFYYERYGDLSKTGNFERCLADMMSYTRISRLQPDAGQLRRDFQHCDRSYASLFALLQEQNMRRLGKSRWADKSLNAEGRAETIFQDFPTAKMIHIIRDPRDRYVSQATHRGQKRGKVGGAAAFWLWSVRLAESNRRAFGRRYKVVRYEDLVAQPEAILRDVCDFIGEAYSPEMLMIDHNDGDTAVSTRVPRQIWTRSVGRYHEAMSAGEIAFMGSVLGERMRALGYQPDQQQLPFSTRAKVYAADYPLNLARMALALSQLSLRASQGGQPSDRRLAAQASSTRSLEMS